MTIVIQKQYIIINTRMEGLHQWRDCPIEEMSYLRDLHRHEFHIKVAKHVSHSDRDIEIIMFKREVENYLAKKYFDPQYACLNFQGMSCEMIAEELLSCFSCYSVEVLEDGENGALVFQMGAHD